LSPIAQDYRFSFLTRTQPTPDPPFDLIATAMSGSQIDLTWNSGSSNNIGFKILRKTEQNDPYELIDTVSSDTETYRDFNLSPSTKYYYAICSFNYSGDSSTIEANASTPVLTYSITIDSGIVGGIVVSEKENAGEGDTVTLTVSPDNGKQLIAGSLIVSYNTNQAAPLTPGPDNTFTFTMPAYDVTVTAQFEDISSKGDVNADGLVDISDVVMTVNFILGKNTPTPAQAQAADYNGDGAIDIADVVQIVNMILGR
jgi:hypothetical protein